MLDPISAKMVTGIVAVAAIAVIHPARRIRYRRNKTYIYICIYIYNRQVLEFTIYIRQAEGFIS